MDLTASEIRVLGCLIEKQRTTPDAYPLTFNALRLACNQSTNRDPVVDYGEDTLREAIGRLVRRRWIRLASGHGSRASKYRHLLDDELRLDREEMAVLAVLMLRGAQTVGELKQRTERLHAFAGLDEVEAALERLAGRELAVRLERRPGQKEARYAHTLAEDEPPGAGAAAPAPAAAPPAATGDRIAELEAEVARLRAENAELRARLGRDG